MIALCEMTVWVGSHAGPFVFKVGLGDIVWLNPTVYARRYHHDHH